jgi:hypothetical protein
LQTRLACIRQRAARWMPSCSHGRCVHKLSAYAEALLKSNVPKLARVLQEEETGTPVLPATSPLLQDEGLQMLLDEIDVPVLLVGN